MSRFGISESVLILIRKNPVRRLYRRGSVKSRDATSGFSLRKREFFAERMHVGTLRRLALALFAVAGMGGINSCSTTELQPVAVPTVAPPKYVQVPQPAGFDVADVAGLFSAQGAPSRESIKDCDSDFRKLRSATPSDDEVRQGVRELVKQDPVAYHWCFYGKILDLEASVKSVPYVDDRQKRVLETYGFLAPVARAFMKEYNDSRYLRWAIRHYRGLSAWIFQRKLEQNEETTRELVQVANPFGLWRDPNPSRSVLEKYNLTKPASEPSPQPIFPPAEESIASESAPSAAPSPAASSPERFPATDPDAVDPSAPEASPALEPVPSASVSP